MINPLINSQNNEMINNSTYQNEDQFFSNSIEDILPRDKIENKKKLSKSSIDIFDYIPKNENSINKLKKLKKSAIQTINKVPLKEKDQDIERYAEWPLNENKLKTREQKLNWS